MREHLASVDDVLVDQAQCPEIISETMAHQNRLGVDKIQQITLHLRKSLGDVQHVFFRDAAEFRVVIDDLRARLDERVVHNLAVQIDEGDSGKLQTLQREAHLAVHRVDAVVVIV